MASLIRMVALVRLLCTLVKHDTESEGLYQGLEQARADLRCQTVRIDIDSESSWMQVSS